MINIKSLAPPLGLGLANLKKNTTLASPIDVDNIQQYNFNEEIISVGERGSSAMEWATYILLILGICVMAYYTTRWLAKYQKRLNIKSKYMQVLDVLVLDQENKIYILRAPQGILMVGTTPKGISVLDKFNSEEVEIIEEVESDISVPRFEDYMERFLADKNDLLGENSGDES